MPVVFTKVGQTVSSAGALHLQDALHLHEPWPQEPFQGARVMQRRYLHIAPTEWLQILPPIPVLDTTCLILNMLLKEHVKTMPLVW